ncbi:MAG: DUF262 domain-containing protein [Candidatus Helarchaeota archaeon]
MERYIITRTLYKVSDFIEWQRNGSLELSPSFQRRSVWKPSEKSYLIDTIVRGLPIPIIFIREVTDSETLKSIRQVVDGQQRIRTLLSYINPESLNDYKNSRDFFQVRKVHNTELAGKDFNELPNKLRQQILDYQFSVHILPSDVDDKQVLQIFARMNATGVRLNYQELRNASFFGIFKETMYNLAYEQLERWRKWEIFSEHNIARMDEVEMTSDLVLMMFQGITTKSKAALDNLYKKYDEKFSEKKVVEHRFRSVMDYIADTWGAALPYMQFKRKTLFYSLFGVVYDFQYGLKSALAKSSKRPLPRNLGKAILRVDKLFAEQKVPEKVARSITTRTSTSASRKAIFDYLKRQCSNG